MGRRQVAALKDITRARSELHVSRAADGTLLVRLMGHWSLQGGVPSLAEVQAQADAAPRPTRLAFEARELAIWDSALLVVLRDLADLCARRHIALDRAGLPEGIRRLLDLAAVPEPAGAPREEARASVLVRVGNRTIAWAGAARGTLAFIGDACLALLKLLHGRMRFRRADLAVLLQDCGAQALPLVTLISFLIGTILAFIGSVQLRQFGAQIYVADLVALAMALELGAMMTAVIMAGRTGAAFAAQLGTMRVNQELDALTTLGLSPMEFLVVPRLLALGLMVPLLTVYADLMGILGGAVVSAAMLDIASAEYFGRARAALSLTACAQGLLKSAVYGVLVALAGCLRGLQSGRSAAAVGAAATSAVVTGIVLIVVASAVLTVIFQEVW
jgi:phospholipid/cholesterol/gamma-HCH transport system permease protein